MGRSTRVRRGRRRRGDVCLAGCTKGAGWSALPLEYKHIVLPRVPDWRDPTAGCLQRWQRNRQLINGYVMSVHSLISSAPLAVQSGQIRDYGVPAQAWAETYVGAAVGLVSQ